MRTTKAPIWPRGCAVWIVSSLGCQTVYSLSLRFKYALLTFITLWTNSADDKLILFFIFPRKHLTSCFLGKYFNMSSAEKRWSTCTWVMSCKTGLDRKHISHVVSSGPSLSAYRLITIQTVCMKCQTLFSEKKKKKKKKYFIYLSSESRQSYKKVRPHPGGLTDLMICISFTFVCVNADINECTLVLCNSTKINKEVLKRCFHWTVTSPKSPLLYNNDFSLNIFYFIEVTIQSSIPHYSLGFQQKHTAYLVHLLIHIQYLWWTFMAKEYLYLVSRWLYKRRKSWIVTTD